MRPENPTLWNKIRPLGGFIFLKIISDIGHSEVDKIGGPPPPSEWHSELENKDSYNIHVQQKQKKELIGEDRHHIGPPKKRKINK